MADLQHMSRVLYHHDWADVEDWARNIAELADLSDEDIKKLECCCEKEASLQDAGPAQELAETEARPSLAHRTRQYFRENFRLPLRRAC
jgi:hypothetical protein